MGAKIGKKSLDVKKGLICSSPHVTYYKHQIGRALCQAAHQVGIPLRTIRNIDAHIVALAHQFFLQVTTNTVQHLKFKGLFADAMVTSILAGGIDDSFVLCGKSGIITLL